MSAMTPITAAEPVDPASAENWAPMIKEAWGRSVAAVVDTGRLLAEAKAALGHGEWMRLCHQLLPFSHDKARDLMAIAAHERLANYDHARNLPSSWTTLAALARLDNKTFDEALDAGVITPDMERRQAQRLVRAGSVEAFRAAPGAAAPRDETDPEDQALENAAAVVRRFMAVRLPVGGLSREAAATIEAVATIARCATDALWRAETLSGAERARAVTARRLAIYMLHMECGMSQPEACQPFGLESSGASYMAKEFEDYREEGSAFERLIERIQATRDALLRDGFFEDDVGGDE